MPVLRFPERTDVDALLRAAIAERRLITFTLHNLPRRAEPHDYGAIHGVRKLFFYQVGGGSRSGAPFGWRWAELADLRDVVLLDERFSGSRDSGSGRHVHWDQLFASVSRNPDN